MKFHDTLIFDFKNWQINILNNPEWKKYYWTALSKMYLAKEKNVIIFILKSSEQSYGAKILYWE